MRSPALRYVVAIAGVMACGPEQATDDMEAREALTHREWVEAVRGSFETDLSIALTGPAEATPGEQIDLTVTVTNHGPKAPLDYSIDIELTPHLELRSSSANCQEYRPPGGLSCSRLNGIEAGSTLSATVTADVVDSPSDGRVRIRSEVHQRVEWAMDTNTSNDATEWTLTVTP